MLTEQCWLCSPSLSISMTACSSILALGMMPLCLLIYTPLWTSAGTIKIPYDSIGEFSATFPANRSRQMATRWCKCGCALGITLVALLVPIALGIYVKRRWPEKARKILRVGWLWSSLFVCFFCMLSANLVEEESQAVSVAHRSGPSRALFSSSSWLWLEEFFTSPPGSSLPLCGLLEPFTPSLALA